MIGKRKQSDKDVDEEITRRQSQAISSCKYEFLWLRLKTENATLISAAENGGGRTGGAVVVGCGAVVRREREYGAKNRWLRQ